MTSVDRAAYMKRKARQYGFAPVALAERYIVAITQAQTANPDRCRAFIDDEAERIIRVETERMVRGDKP